MVDAAQDPRVYPGLVDEAVDSCLFAEHIGDEISRNGPHLVSVPLAGPHGLREDSPYWVLINQLATLKPCIQLMASDWAYAELLTALRQASQVRLPDGDEMVLALWDPAILATLVACAEDTSLHVPGPALTRRQIHALLRPVRAWWYWNRHGLLLRLNIPPVTQIAAPDAALTPGTDSAPFHLAQVQVDMLVEASVPDHLLQHLRINHPQLLHSIPESQHYSQMELHLREARQHGLRGMRDLLNFICAALIFGPRFDSDPAVLSVLAQVRNKTLTMSEAMQAFPS
nr:DUF4123 domain-containing protein [Roseateles koreensis]